MNLNYAKNFTKKNILEKILSFIIYFFVAGFSGKLMTILVRPVLKFFTRDNFDVENSILYILGIIFMSIILSHLSKRDGYNDMEHLKFSFLKAILSYIAAALLFYLLCVVIESYYMQSQEYILGYFFFLCFPSYSIIDFVTYAPIIGDISFTMQSYLYIGGTAFCFGLIIFIDTILIIIFYRVGRSQWRKDNKGKIRRISGTKISTGTVKKAGKTEIKSRRLNKLI